MVRIDVPSTSRHLSRVQALPHATCSDTDPSQIENGGEKKSVRKYKEVEKPQWPPTVTPTCFGGFSHCCQSSASVVNFSYTEAAEAD